MKKSNQITLTVPQDIIEPLKNLSVKYGFNDSLAQFTSEIIKAVVHSPELIDKMDIANSGFDSLVYRTIQGASESRKDQAFFVNSFLTEEEWNGLDSGFKKTLALKLANYVKSRPDRFEVTKLRNINFYQAISDPDD